MSDLDAQISAAEGAEQAAQRELVALPTEDLMAELARLRGEAAVSAGQLQSYQARVEELLLANGNVRARWRPARRTAGHSQPGALKRDRQSPNRKPSIRGLRRR